MQPQRNFGSSLAMFLCYASSEDDIGPATALRTVSRRSQGWQSSKNGAYPQELGFRFEGLVQLDLIRLLAHECKIPSSINVSVAAPTQEELQRGVCSGYETATFHPLGHVRFHANSEKEFLSRELKSVGVQQRCTYLKLRLNRPHKDTANPFSQVSLVALTAHGTLVQTMSHPSTGNVRAVMVSETIETPLERMAPLTKEESEAVNYDAVEVIASKIEVLQQEKLRAVAAEDYDRAGRLKAQITALEKARSKVAKLEEEKRTAVKTEDYARAKQLRLEIQHLISVDSPQERSPVAQPPGQQARQEPAQPSVSTTLQPSSSLPSSPQPSSKSAAPAPQQAARGGAALGGGDSHEEAVVGGKGFYDLDNTKDPFGPSSSGSVAGPSGRTGGGEQEVPQNGSGAPWERQLNAAIAGFIPDKSAPTALVGDSAQEGKLIERDLGVYCTACLLAKRGQLREAALRGVVSDAGYRAVSGHTANAAEALLTYMATKGRGLSDPVAGVVFAACEAIVKVVAAQLPGERPPDVAHLAPLVAAIAPEVVGRIGDANARIRESAEGVISAVARSPIGPDRFIALLMADPDKEAKKVAGYRAHLARVNVLSHFVDTYGLRHQSTSSHALDTRQLLSQVVLPSMQNANSEVREAAAGLFARLILLDGPTAQPALANLKPAQQGMVEAQVQQFAATPSKGNDRSAATPDSANARRSEPPSSLSSPKQPQRQQDGPGKQVSQNPYADANVADRPSKTLPPLESMGAGMSARDVEFRSLHTCQFCGEFNKNFTDNILDIHYVRACPMLCPCPLCDQVTEICTLQRHLVSECEGRHLVRECPRCHEAVRAEDFKRHVAVRSCIEAVAAFSVCPLCHTRFGAGMDGWRRHLAAAPGCPNNPRKYDGSGPVMQ